MNKLMLTTLAGLALVISLPVSAAGDKAAGKDKAAVCAACHGADGNSVNPEWPKLAGQHESYIAKQLADFKAGNRQNALMSPQAAALSDQDMADLSAYYSGNAMTPGTADEAAVELGKAVYRGGNSATGVAACMACHGPSGSGIPEAKFPRVAGQQAKYIATQLYAFRTGARANDGGKMMRNIAIRMNDAEIEAVSQYMAGLQK